MDTLNKSLAEIKSAYLSLLATEDEVREMMRNWFSRNLMDTNENNKVECNICLEDEETFGLSSNDIPHVVGMWQYPTEGYIIFDMRGGHSLDFDELDTSILLEIMEESEDLFFKGETMNQTNITEQEIRNRYNNGEDVTDLIQVFFKMNLNGRKWENMLHTNIPFSVETSYGEADFSITAMWYDSDDDEVIFLIDSERTASIDEFDTETLLDIISEFNEMQ